MNNTVPPIDSTAKSTHQPDESPFRQSMHDAVIHGLRHYFSDHGDMKPSDIGSATKRIMGKVWVVCKPMREYGSQE